MGYVRSHKFCCCIPVRLGVFVMSTVGLLGATIVAAVGWHGAVNRGASLRIAFSITFLSFYRATTPEQEPGCFHCAHFHLLYHPCHRFPLWVRSLDAT